MTCQSKCRSSDDANANIPIMISSMTRITHTHLWLTHTHTSLTHTHSLHLRLIYAIDTLVSPPEFLCQPPEFLLGVKFVGRVNYKWSRDLCSCAAVQPPEFLLFVGRVNYKWSRDLCSCAAVQPPEICWESQLHMVTWPVQLCSCAAPRNLLGESITNGHVTCAAVQLCSPQKFVGRVWRVGRGVKQKDVLVTWPVQLCSCAAPRNFVGSQVCWESSLLGVKVWFIILWFIILSYNLLHYLMIYYNFFII
jgi:hypothetical protein